MDIKQNFWKFRQKNSKLTQQKKINAIRLSDSNKVQKVYKFGQFLRKNSFWRRRELRKHTVISITCGKWLNMFWWLTVTKSHTTQNFKINTDERYLDEFPYQGMKILKLFDSAKQLASSTICNTTKKIRFKPL